MSNPTSESAKRAYDKIDRFLRNNLDDTDYADFSAALDLVYADDTPIAQTADAQDAARYRWLRADDGRGAVSLKIRLVSWNSEDALDAAIDAAIHREGT